ncbi:MAG: EpsG family protein [Fibrobacter sp.]|uniref:EpsG family protein n=1 Tax=Fibrobacter sp. TaxID=35828 RepID=UPI0025BBE351|nr:EpsG family protein [Fibrobacter sp.]MBQ9224891.1 EpsG family protein [Fibrobacter sp.]
MIVMFLVGIVCLVLVHYASKDHFPYGLEWSFFILFFFAAIHYNFGNDYQSYMGIFDELNNRQFDWYYILRKKYFSDIGWAVICYLFRPVGFFPLIATIALVENVAYYLLVKKFVPKEWWVLAVFIYLFSDNLYILNMSVLRQGLAASLFVFVFFLMKKFNVVNLLLGILIIFLISTIHGTAVILYPCLLLFFVKKEWAPYLTIPLVFLLVVLFVFPDYVNNFLLSIENLEEMAEYKKYYERGEARSLSVGVIWRLLPFFVSGYYCIFSKDVNETDLKIVLLSMLGFVLIPFSLAIPMIDRLCYFFAPFMVASIPITYKTLPSKYMHPLLFLQVAYFLYGYWQMFHSPTWMESYYHFHSIFEVIF